MDAWGWLILAVAIGIAVFLSGPKGKTAAPGEPAKKRERAVEGNHWPETGSCDFNVVGESNYQRDLQRLAGDHGDKRCRKSCTATLVLEDNNEHDNKAVRIDVDRTPVGYLSRDDARRYRRRLGSKGLTGKTMTCKARIGGGQMLENGQRASYGVWLDLKPFDR